MEDLAFKISFVKTFYWLKRVTEEKTTSIELSENVYFFRQCM